jgi:hypothetical protein
MSLAILRVGGRGEGPTGALCGVESLAFMLWRDAGRLAIELPYVMPDKKTVYITDDGDNTMLGMYVASEPGDLSCGSLYAPKFTQLDAANGACPLLAHFLHCAPPATLPLRSCGCLKAWDMQCRE